MEGKKEDITMKVLLTAINAKYIHSNLAVYSLREYARSCRTAEDAVLPFEIEIAEYTINQKVNDILKDIYKKKPDILCFSCYIWNIQYVEDIVREIVKIFPFLPIWLGGPEVSYDSKQVLERLPGAAGVMKGEGEETFAELTKVYMKLGTDAAYSAFEQIAGITYRSHEGEIVQNSWREPLDLNCVPFVYSDVNDFQNRIIYYETSRGCPFSCSYCLSSIDKKLRFRKLPLVKKELSFFISHKVPQVKFVDRTFNCSHHHAMEIWQYIKENDNGVTNFHFEVAADLLDDEELALMRDMRPGLIQLEIGVQSTNRETLKEIRRSMDFDRVKIVAGRIHNFGNIHQHLDLIAGLPHEDMISFRQSFDDVYALRPDQLQLGFLKVLKGSWMEQCREEYGLKCQSQPPYEVLFTKWLDYGDLLRLKGIEEMVEVYYNSGQYRHTLEALGREFASSFDIYDMLWGYYEEKGFDSIQHKRNGRYEILLEFITGILPDKSSYYRELLTFDYYLRENAKNRPLFAGSNAFTKEECRIFYEQEEKNRIYLKEYEGYDRNQLRRMTHLERFRQLGVTVLFDYAVRNPLNQEARTYKIEI